MSTLTLADPIVNPATADNPRDSWPAWTDQVRWELGPEADPIPDDEPRPSAGPDFEPAPEDDAEWLGFRLALDAVAENLAYDAMHAERMEAAFGDPDDFIPHEERARVLGHRAYA